MSLGKCQNRDSLFLEFGCSVSQNRDFLFSRILILGSLQFVKGWTLLTPKKYQNRKSSSSNFQYHVVLHDSIPKYFGNYFCQNFWLEEIPPSWTRHFDNFDKLTKKCVTLKNKHIWFWIIYSNVMKKKTINVLILLMIANKSQWRNY